MGHYGQSQTLGQGQDTYLAESNVTAIFGVIGIYRTYPPFRLTIKP